MKREKAVCGWTRLLFQSNSNKGKKWGWGFVVVCEWTRCVVQKEEEKIKPGQLERGRFKYAFAQSISRPVAGWRGEDQCDSNPIEACGSLCGRFGQGQLATCHTRGRHRVWQELQSVCLHGVGHVLFISVRIGLARLSDPHQAAPDCLPEPQPPPASRHFELAAVPARAESTSTQGHPTIAPSPGCASEKSASQPPQVRG